MSILYCHICGKTCNDEFETLSHYGTVHNQQFTNGIGYQDILNAKRKAKSAAIAAILSGVVTTILALTGFVGFDKWYLLDAALTFGPLSVC
jgi:hypothetical protein